MQTLNSYRAWVFDLDGTLTVSLHDFGELRTRLGFAEGAAILETIEMAPVSRRQGLLEVVAEWEWDVARRTLIAPGADTLLASLTDRGVRLGIVTRNRRDIALHTLKQIDLDRYFADVDILGRDDAPPKPDPAGVLKLLRGWGGPQPTVMVGDYLYDLQAGRAAGCDTVLVGPELPPSWEQWVSGHVRSLRELLLT